MSRTDESGCRWRNVNHATDTALLGHVFSFGTQFPVHSKHLLRALAPCECRIADHAISTQVPFLSYCDAIYACVAAFALKMPLKLSRYCRKTRIHNTQATRAGAMVAGDIVRGNARML